MSKSILDKSFRYVPSHATDVAKTFAKVRKAMNAAPQVTGENHEARDETRSPAVAEPLRRVA